MASVFTDFRSVSSANAIMSKLTCHYPLNHCTFLTSGHPIAKRKQWKIFSLQFTVYCLQFIVYSLSFTVRLHANFNYKTVCFLGSQNRCLYLSPTLPKREGEKTSRRPAIPKHKNNRRFLRLFF